MIRRSSKLYTDLFKYFYFDTFNYKPIELLHNLHPYWSLLYDILKGGLVRSTWLQKKYRLRTKNFTPPKTCLSIHFVCVSTFVFREAFAVSGKSAIRKINDFIDRTKAKIELGPWNPSEIDSYALYLLKRGCLREPLFMKPPKDYTPMLPAMVALWHCALRPPGFLLMKEPNCADAAYLRLIIFRCLNIMCSRGLRGGDPLHRLEKNLSRQELLGSPKFNDLMFCNDHLQIKLTPPSEIILHPVNSRLKFIQLWNMIKNHPETYLTINLRWIKNFKDANFLSKLVFTRSSILDMCLVHHFILLVNHRLRFYANFCWHFIFSLPRMNHFTHMHYTGRHVIRGEIIFLPFTKKRYEESWREYRKFINPHTKFSIHDMRRGLQKALRRSRVMGHQNIPEDVCTEYGLWKRPKNKRSSQYAGQDGILLDKIFNKLLLWDIACLASNLPPRLMNDLYRILVSFINFSYNHLIFTEYTSWYFY